ncbi:[protein release factor]-glutamine N5-methyltransferase [Litoreibacter halocynthiae]|uniref:Release factor glutamine methyltransferase n=1 Tax=Litoreibacter halocynthiae TaxID=1242689 RepID=A0A4R7LPZ2_9RHOB|nr:peptide chain release factor N(5)-glutamine methyltransferase [Litoreibacter halocynthiae]TDT77549.1 [protein release factor]-glutamine N5-methyltransferase [Litoreibacter halocynthiae]
MSDALSSAIVRLHEAGIPDPSNEARRLEALAAEQNMDLAELVARRVTHEPFSHIAGRRAFWNHEFIVSSAVLDPRPDTETLVEAALTLPFDTVLDLGTGSGCILCSLLAERLSTTGTGTDISPDALDVARRNAALTGTQVRATFIESNWFAGVDGRFDLIVSNPPYITEAAYRDLHPTVHRFEPRIALTPGGDGLDPYRVIAAESTKFLTEDGFVLVEIGYDQGALVQSLFKQHGWRDVACIPDLNGKDRVIRAKAPE